MLQIIGWLLLALIISGLIAFIEDSLHYLFNFKRINAERKKNAPMSKRDIKRRLKGTLTEEQWHKRINNHRRL